MATQPSSPTSRSTRVSDADHAGQVQPWTPQTSVRQTAAALRPPQGMTLSRLAFYGGAIALRGLGVVEWPVTLLVMADTYVADRARPTADADSVVDASPPRLRSPPPPRRTVLPSPAERNGDGCPARSATRFSSPSNTWKAPRLRR